MAVDIIARAIASGKADLVNGKVPASELPSYVDDVIEGYYFNGQFYLDQEHTQVITPESGKIYVDLSTNSSYRWSGSAYVQIGGVTSWGDIIGTLSNQTDLQNALNAKQATLVSGTNIKTINGNDLLGNGNMAIKTYQPFPNGQITGSLQDVVTTIMAFPGKEQGMAYLGDIAGSSTPWGYGNVECTVTFMTNNIAILSANSSNISPYHWEYNTAQNDYQWRALGGVTAQALANLMEGDDYITVDLNSGNTKVAVSVDADYKPFYVELTGTSGSLTDTQFNQLTTSTKAQIICDDEYYILSDEQEGFIVFSHVGADNQQQTFVKNIYVYTESSAVTYKTWALISKEITTYVLPTASSSSLGGIKVGNNLSIDANGVLSANLPSCPTTTNGVYNLQATVVDGMVTYAWAANPISTQNLVI